MDGTQGGGREWEEEFEPLGQGRKSSYNTKKKKGKESAHTLRLPGKKKKNKNTKWWTLILFFYGKELSSLLFPATFMCYTPFGQICGHILRHFLGKLFTGWVESTLSHPFMQRRPKPWAHGCSSDVTKESQQPRILRGREVVWRKQRPLKEGWETLPKRYIVLQPYPRKKSFLWIQLSGQLWQEGYTVYPVVAA